MKVADVAEALERIAPTSYAEEWDNVGLLVGSSDWPVDAVLLTIDLTRSVLAEAVRRKVGMIVAYHPPIFHPLKSFTDRTIPERNVLEAASRRIAVYSPHTALDAAAGGINDWLIGGLGTGDVRAIAPADELPASERRKVVTFCPADAVDRLRNALSLVGAGRIGDYEQCSFQIEGTGTFFGTGSTSPAIGRKGTLERVDEVRLEMVCPVRSLALAVRAIRQFHPYEEPPIEIYELKPRPDRNVGPGRRLVLDQAISLRTAIERIRKTLGKGARLAAATADPAPARYQTIGVCAGAGGSLVERAIDEGCRLFLTGEMSHHAVLAAQARGCTIVLAGHTNTERGYLPVLRKRLAAEVSDLRVAVSRADRDPLRRV